MVNKLKMAFLCIGPLFFLTHCSHQRQGPPEVDPAFVQFISGFSSGIISNSASIKIQLAEPVAGVDLDNPVSGLFTFSPKIEGEARWTDGRTIEFKPAQRLSSGQVINGVFHLGKVIDLPKNLREFPFQVQVIDQFVDVQVQPLMPVNGTDPRWYTLWGEVHLADLADAPVVEQIVTTSKLPGRSHLRWIHDNDQLVHRFVIDSIERQEASFGISIDWNAKPLALDLKGNHTVQVPAFGQFVVLEARADQYPSQLVRVFFSDPILENQDLRGLVEIKGQTIGHYYTGANQVMLRPRDQLVGSVEVDVHPGVKNTLGFSFLGEHRSVVIFNDIQPQIRLLGSGVIIPESNGLLFPFEAVNLHAVQVKVTKVFETNIAQFLQVNELDGSNEIRRVGKVVYNRKLELKSDRPINRGAWNRFSIKLDDLIKPEPGAIYRIELSMRKEFSALECARSKNGFTALEIADHEDQAEPDDDYYGFYDDWYDSGEDYNWNERNDPCKPSYYQYYGRKVVRNVLASNLGVICKAGTVGGLTAVVTDLRSTKPLSGVKVDVVDYQQQVIGSGSTDNNGQVALNPQGKPYLLVARSGPQRGYLKVDNGSALSVSMFEVDGQTARKGLKGFIYGERGVWRPGDTLFLSFMLFDRDKVLPPNHPVVLELHDCRGNLHTRTVRTQGLNGLYDFRINTRNEDPTGNWTATVKAGGNEFSRTIKIETIKPNRLKIDVKFPAQVLTKNTGQKLALDVKWLHGATARNMKATVDLTLAEAREPFPQYKNYTFSDPTRYFYSEESRVFEGKTDDNGLAPFNLGIQVSDNVPGMLMAGLNIKVFEPGGDFSIDRNKVLYSPYEGYVGFKVPEGKGWRGSLSSNETHAIPVVTLSPDGRPISRNGLIVEVFKLDWRWWWEGDDDGLSRYVNNASAYRIKRIEMNTQNGKGQFDLRMENNFWGRALVRISDPSTGHSAAQVVRFTYDGWLANMGDEGAKGATMLMFDLEKDTFNVGQEVRFTVPSAKGGRALLSLENGSGIVAMHWFELKDGHTPISFKVTKEMSPTVYAHVSLIQPHGQTVNDRPIRMYGIQPITVQDPATVLKPVIEMPAELRPEQTFSISVSEASGRAMTYTLAVVDEGLLDLTRFKTPAPHPHFYAKEALGVRTWDLYDLVLGAKAGELAGLLAVGGDEYNRPKGGKKADRFKPVVKYLGPFTLAPGKKATHTIKLPNYIGSVRAMVVAGQDLAYGNAEKTVPVRKPLMALTTLPRVLGPGERVQLPVTLFAMDKKVSSVEVKLQVSGPLQIEGPSTKTVLFNEIGEQMAYFNLIVPETIGKATVKITATGGGEVAEDKTDIDVRLGNLPVRQVFGKVLAPGEEADITFEPPGMAGTNRAKLEVSGIPAIDLNKRLGYLISYPHGCIEQTVSGAFPQLVLDKLVNLTDPEKADVANNVKAALGKLRNFQTGSGGFAYWPGQAEASAWGTSYAGHFMIEAKNRGYNLPAGLLDTWKKHQAKQARDWAPPKVGDPWNNDELSQAYRLFTLALANSAELGAMNRMLERGVKSANASYRLAAAYQLAGRPDVAKRLVDGAANQMNASLRNSYTEFDGTFGSTERDLAMMLETLQLMGRDREAFQTMTDLSKRLGSEAWYSTQTTAYSLLAIANYAGKSAGVGVKFSYTASNGKKGDMATDKSLASLDLDYKGKAKTTVKVRNNGASTVYARVVAEGIPVTGDKTAAQSNLSMSVRYLDLSGKPIDQTKLKQGTDFMAEVTLKHPASRDHYRNMALSQVFASGWEVVNMRLTDDGGPINAKFDYQDIRDDRVYTYFSLNQATTVTYRVLLNASYTGRFFLPSVYCEAMYDNEVSARLPGQWVEVQ